MLILILTALAILNSNGSISYFTKSSGRISNLLFVISEAIILRGLTPLMDISLNLVLPLALYKLSKYSSMLLPENNPLFLNKLIVGPIKGNKFNLFFT